jgi:putative tricarboxylic transport membrane protein
MQDADSMITHCTSQLRRRLASTVVVPLLVTLGACSLRTPSLPVPGPVELTSRVRALLSADDRSAVEYRRARVELESLGPEIDNILLELAYDPAAGEDEAIQALREVIPQPDGYPARPVEVLIGFGEGGGSDNYTRNVGRDAERIMGQRLVYNNMPGASGEVALGHMLTQATDGYTIASAITNQVINNALDYQPYSFVDDVEFIIRQQGPTEIYWVAADNEWETFEDMLEYAADNPGQVRVSGSGVGGDDEFRLLALGAEIDSEFGFVPFDGVGGRISALLSGDIDVLHETAGTVMDLYEDGQIRPLAYGGDIVFEDVDPDIPSVADLGYPVPTGRWRGMVAPAGVDQQIIDYLHNVFYASSQLPFYTDYEEEFLQDLVPGYLNSADFEAEARDERDRVEQLAQELGYDVEALEEEAE